MGSCELEYESFGGLATPEWSSWELSHAPGMLPVHRKNGALDWMGLTSFFPFFLWFHEAWHTFVFFCIHTRSISAFTAASLKDKSLYHHYLLQNHLTEQNTQNGPFISKQPPQGRSAHPPTEPQLPIIKFGQVFPRAPSNVSLPFQLQSVWVHATV